MPSAGITTIREDGSLTARPGAVAPYAYRDDAPSRADPRHEAPNAPLAVVLPQPHHGMVHLVLLSHDRLGRHRHPVSFDADTIAIAAKLPIRIVEAHAIGALAAHDPVLAGEAAKPLAIGRLRIAAIVTRLRP